jgi:dienelactone hydrolase
LVEGEALKRVDVSFLSRGAKCAAWLYLPDGVANPPIVVMAHGFGADKVLRLPAFAEKFVEHGLAALVFDYRNFGDSEGEPRNLISPKRHLEDWKAAIEFARTLSGINPQKIALWGTSFSGGHVLATAAAVPGISAVVAQVPFVDGIASAAMYPLKFSLEAFGHGLIDLFSMIFLRKPHNVPVVSEPDRFGLMNTPECMPGYKSLEPPNYVPKNFAPARIVFTLPFYRPVKSAAKITCPVMIICAEKDTLIPVQAVKKTAGLIRNAKLVSLPVGHFEVYTGDWFEKVSKLEADFLAESLAK